MGIARHSNHEYNDTEEQIAFSIDHPSAMAQVLKEESIRLKLFKVSASCSQVRRYGFIRIESTYQLSDSRRR